MNIVDLIRTKRDGGELSRDEIEWAILSYTEGKIPDYQMSALLMAVCVRGMSGSETIDLTMAMAHSGRILDLSTIPGFKVDKHSTGGVGDKVSLVLAPLVASCGVPVPMVSGRGLGHTGGTLDKLESIPGYRTDLTVDQFIRCVELVGCCIMGQTAEMAPADGKMYALRDVTGTVESIPLISASIMSKKIAAGVDGLVLDVKAGSGAFMQEIDQAEELARSLLEIGKGAGKEMVALITTMEQPLGYAVGNAIEMEESLAVLAGEGPPDVREITLALGAEMLVIGRAARSLDRAREVLSRSLDNGKGLETFRRMVEVQGGDTPAVDHPERLPHTRGKVPVPSPEAGYVSAIDTRAIGLVASSLGAGRQALGDPIDPRVGILIHKKLGDQVEIDEPLATVLSDDDEKATQAVSDIAAAYQVSKAPSPIPPLIHARLDLGG
jgi:pyrimidine-nucleoside phosphorylase